MRENIHTAKVAHNFWVHRSPSLGVLFPLELSQMEIIQRTGAQLHWKPEISISGNIIKRTAFQALETDSAMLSHRQAE